MQNTESGSKNVEPPSLILPEPPVPIVSHLPAALGITFIMVAILVGMGRPWWCAGGEWFLVSKEVLSMHNSQHLLDAYSFSHFQHGLVFFGALYLLRNYIGRPKLWLALVIEAVWEILENSPWIIDKYRSQTMALNYSGDTIGNSLGDMLACGFGFYLCSRFPWKWSLGIYVVIELGMLYMIKDNLTLNVLMLVYPIEAIKHWQAPVVTP